MSKNKKLYYNELKIGSYGGGGKVLWKIWTETVHIVSIIGFQSNILTIRTDSVLLGVYFLGTVSGSFPPNSNNFL